MILTDAQYGDFEVVLEMRNDFGPDCGLFLRGTEEGSTGSQVMIDYHANGTLAGLHGEGLQVHGGGNFTNQFVRYRALRVMDLSTPAQDE